MVEIKLFTMNDQTIDLSDPLQPENLKDSRPIQEMVIQTLEKFDVTFQEIDNEVKFMTFEVLWSREKHKKSFFKEKESVSYRFTFTTYNMEFLVRLLTFQSDNKCEILKLDIQPKTAYKKELEYCRNSLQRRRNLNLMFKTLITFARFIESRRLICDLILKKNRNIKIEDNKDGGIIIIYSDETRNVKLGIFWSITCNSRHEIMDVVEVYYKDIELPNQNEITSKLAMLTEPCLDFNIKYHLWKDLINDVTEKSLVVMIDKMNDTSRSGTVSSSSHRNLGNANKVTILCSDSEDLPEKAVVDKISDNSLTTVVTSNCKKNKGNKDKEVTILSSDSEDAPEMSGEELPVPLSDSSDLQTKLIISEEKPGSSSQDSSITMNIQKTQQYDESKNESGLIIDLSDSKNPSDKKTECNISSLGSNVVPTVNIGNANSRSQTNKIITDIPSKETNGKEILRTRGQGFPEVNKSSVESQGRQIHHSTEEPKKKGITSAQEVNTKMSQISENIYSEGETADCLDSQTLSKKSHKHINTKSRPSSALCLSVKSNESTDDFEGLSNGEECGIPKKRIKKVFCTEADTTNSNSDLPTTKSQIKNKIKYHALLKRGERNPSIDSGNDIRGRRSSVSSESRPKSRTEQRRKPLLSLPIKTSNCTKVSSVTPNNALVVPNLSNNSLSLNSVVPNILTSNSSSLNAVRAGTHQNDVRVSLVPELQANNPPSFLGLNSIAPETEDDLEITSVTYVIPD